VACSKVDGMLHAPLSYVPLTIPFIREDVGLLNIMLLRIPIRSGQVSIDLFCDFSDCRKVI